MLRRLLSFVFAGLLAVSSSGRAELLDTNVLTKIAARYKLPEPPKGAPLVLAHTESWSVLGNQSTSRDPAIYSPAFLLEEKANGSIVVLRGTERETLEGTRGEPLWRPFSTARVEPKLGGHVVSFNLLSAFVCAVQVASRGEGSTAQELWERFAAEKYWSGGGFRDNPAEQVKNPSLLLARCVFDHLRNEVLQQPSKWSDVHAQLSTLFNEFPALKTDDRKEVFDGLTAAIQAKAPKPDSVEALVLDWSRRPSQMRHLGLFQDGENAAADAPARAIVLRGASAVPELISLLDDHRITVHEGFAINAPARIRVVGELAGLLLEQITGIHASSPWETPKAETFRAWLKKRGDKGEEDVLAESIFTYESGKITGVNESPARILAQKFPNRLLTLCDEFSKNATAEAQSFSLAEALTTSGLPKETRVKALVEFAQKGSLEHKRCVLQNLASIDEKRCAELLDPIFESMPKDASGPYWTSPEAGITHVVMLIENDETWRRYLQVAKRSSVGLRMEMMNPLCYTYIGRKNQSRRLKFAAEFLDDESLRDLSTDSTKFEGPCAAFTIPKITVRDFAAMKIASMIGIEASPDEFWTAPQWEALRKKVREKLATGVTEPSQ
ncbi:MAG: hypothetical protein JWM68_572 [Verrucomicrobiales bacterium]|nr:hypothetical protein [Verrucomicrobiales bacterium]